MFENSGQNNADEKSKPFHADLSANESDFTDYAEQQAFDASPTTIGRLKLTRGNILLIGLFAAGIACVYGLSLRKGPEAASASDQAIEQQVNQFIATVDNAQGRGSERSESQRIVESLYHHAARQQVPLEDLNSNPFVFTDSNREKQVKQSGPSPEQIAAGKKRAEVDAEFAQLRLQSIMTGPRGGTAIINNNFLSEGQMIGSLRISRIQQRSVELTWNDVTYTLRISE